MSKYRATVEEAIEEIKKGKMIILVDDEDRENEGDLTIAAEFITPDAINFMAKYARGLICLTLTSERCNELKLPLMMSEEANKSRYGTAFTLSIEAKDGVTTGISAADRAQTIKVAVDPSKGADDLAIPGHIFPIRARRGGVLIRAGQTEGSVDLARLAGLNPAGVICEVMNDDGTMARMPQLEEFAKKFELRILTIADLIAYRLKNDPIAEEAASASLPTYDGEFRILAFHSIADDQEAVALVKGDVADGEPVLVRVHSACITGEVFGSKRCDCGAQLHTAMRMVEEAGRGVILYLSQEGRGIGLVNKIKAYKLQEEGYDTVEANKKLGFKDDLRDYGFGAQVLAKLGVKKMRLLTNNPVKISALSGYGLSVIESLPLITGITRDNFSYMYTKQEKMGHTLMLSKEGE
ncbi:MAG: bifunctional 3,4-dihydroxy-2-butanone-4-phosphate synthase/GTP cyclohydrolase II [Deferribacteraceae bacterium]|jgi:3,4-dihydroxy 2-butanone 4-phosphate synthase/GTP cyclohydrolase II|nr:bifunctional 3,4-dihydroxy-2-butanone-4-phosphate synthase/GTP cyclohydrolase II [Deferribacteraceae bacterium]